MRIMLSSSSLSSSHHNHTHSSMYLAVASGKDVSVWNPQTNSKMCVTKEEDITDLCWNHNGQVLAVCCCGASSSSGDASLVALMEAKAGKTLETIDVAHPVAVRFGGKSRYLCIVTFTGVSVWDLKKRKEVRRFAETEQSILHACMDPSDTFLCTLSPKKVSFYQLREAQLVGGIQSPAPTCEWTCLDLARPTLAALGTSDGRILITDYSLSSPASSSSSLQSSAALAQGGQAGGGGGGAVLKQHILHSRSALIQVSFNPSSTNNVGGNELASNDIGSRLLCALSTDSWAVYGWESGQCLFTKSLDSGSTTNLDQATCLSWNGSWVAIGFASGTVLIEDWKQNTTVTRIGFANMIRQLSFGPSTTVLSQQQQQPSSLLQLSDPMTTSTLITDDSLSKSAADPLVISSSSSRGTSPSFVHPIGAGSTANPSIAVAAHSSAPVSAPVPATAVLAAAFLSTSPLQQQHNPDSAAIAAAASSMTMGSNELQQLQQQQQQQQQSGAPPSAANLCFKDDLNQLQQQVHTALVNLHVDMMRQFQLQSEEFHRVLATQAQVLAQVVQDNRQLRQELAQLRTEQQLHPQVAVGQQQQQNPQNGTKSTMEYDI